MIRSPKRLVYLAIGLAIALLITLVHGAGFIPINPGAAVQAVTSQQEQQGFDLLEAGRVDYQAEQMDDAISTWQSAAERFEQGGDRLHQALALSYLSLAYQYQGRGQQAADAIALNGTNNTLAVLDKVIANSITPEQLVSAQHSSILSVCNRSLSSHALKLAEKPTWFFYQFLF